MRDRAHWEIRNFCHGQPIRAREGDALVKFLVGIMDTSCQKISIAKPPEGPGFIFDRYNFPSKIPCRLMFCQALLALAKKIINVATHMMDAGALQGVLGFDCDSLCRAQFRKSFAMAIGYT